MREAASHGLTVIRLQPQGKRLQITLQPCAFQALIDWLDAPAMRGVNAISLSVTGQPSRPAGSRSTICCWSATMKANWIAGGLLLVLYLLWLTATAPARLLAPMLPPGVQVGQFSGSVWRGAAQPVYWHGERLERLAWSLTLAGWQVSLSDPRGVMGQARLWGLRDLRLQEGRLTAPASLLSRWLMSTMPVKAAGRSPSA